MKNNRSAIQKRQTQLLHYLGEEKNADVAILSELLKVSPITVRRDLDELASRGLVERYFGGARLVSSAQVDDESAYMETTIQHLSQKQAIARCAAEMLEDGDTVFINSSSTALLIYPYIRDKHVLIVTNNGRSLIAPRAPSVELVLTGGEVTGNKQSLVGQLTLETLSRITSTKCIIGVSGISVEGGITTRVLQETSINQAMLRRCNGPKIVVTDSSKIGTQHNFFSGTIHDITHLITDTGADPRAVDAIRSAGVNVTLVEPAEPYACYTGKRTRGASKEAPRVFFRKRRDFYE